MYPSMIKKKQKTIGFVHHRFLTRLEDLIYFLLVLMYVFLMVLYFDYQSV